MKNILTKLGLLFSSKQANGVIEKGIEVTGKNLLHKKIFKIVIAVILAILLIAGSIESDVFINLIKEIL
tara:strand:- start:135 stop:341 length:207 start_codon:yes stop_codon:yes gene_type:complete